MARPSFPDVCLVLEKSVQLEMEQQQQSAADRASSTAYGNGVQDNMSTAHEY